MLSSEARDECSWVRLWWLDHLLQVSFPILMLVSPYFSFISQFVKSWTSMEHDSNWEPKVFSFEASSKYFQRWKTPWRCCPGRTRLYITLSKLTCPQNLSREPKKNTGISIFTKTSNISNLLYKYIHLKKSKYIQELHRQARLSWPPVWPHHRWHKNVKIKMLLLILKMVCIIAFQDVFKYYISKTILDIAYLQRAVAVQQHSQM